MLDVCPQQSYSNPTLAIIYWLRRCIRDALEPGMQDRFLHGLELALATMMGTVVLLCIALCTNNLGPKRYPVYWWT